MKLAIEIVYASPTRQSLLKVMVEPGCTIEEAIKQSGILQTFPEINLERNKVGIFSKPKLLSDTVQAGDRIEIYRPLIIDPKEARRAKAKKKPTPS